VLRHYNNDAERKKEQERREKEKAEHAKIGALLSNFQRRLLMSSLLTSKLGFSFTPHTYAELKQPLSRDQVEDVWETKDHLPRQEFNIKTFFALHDLGQNYNVISAWLTQG
jgi:hypothetical protein